MEAGLFFYIVVGFVHIGGDEEKSESFEGFAFEAEIAVAEKGAGVEGYFKEEDGKGGDS